MKVIIAGEQVDARAGEVQGLENLRKDCVNQHMIKDSNGLTVKSPSGKPSRRILSALEQYPAIPRQAMICNKHAQWINRLDDLWPVYWENNKCKDCP